MHTTIPVPNIWCAFEHRGVVYIAMQRLPGKPLGREWARRSETSKTHILQQLRGYVDQLRNFSKQSKGYSICSIDSSPIFDERLPHGSALVGPFASVRDFHHYLTAGQWLGTYEGDNENIIRLLSLHEATSNNTNLTHNDLSSFNILVDKDHITGIIDWENAAWLPSYWEYTSAWHVNPLNTFWQDEIEHFLNPCERELEMEKLRRQYFGDY